MFEKVNIKYGIVIGLFLTIMMIAVDLSEGLNYDHFFFEGLFYHLFFSLFWTFGDTYLIYQMRDENRTLPSINKLIYFLIGWSVIVFCFAFLPRPYLTYFTIGLVTTGFIYLVYWIFK